MRSNDYNEQDAFCAPRASGNCTKRYDVPGQYYFTSGKVVEGNNMLAFAGRVDVITKKDESHTISVIVKGNFQFFFFKIFFYLFFTRKFLSPNNLFLVD